MVLVCVGIATKVFLCKAESPAEPGKDTGSVHIEMGVQPTSIDGGFDDLVGQGLQWADSEASGQLLSDVCLSTVDEPGCRAPHTSAAPLLPRHKHAVPNAAPAGGASPASL